MGLAQEALPGVLPCAPLPGNTISPFPPIPARCSVGPTRPPGNLPPLCSHSRRELCVQLRQWQLKVIENVKRGQHKKTLERLFPGFRPAVEACYFNWEEAYPLPGVTYSATDRKLALCWARALPPRPGASRSGGLEESREIGRASCRERVSSPV